MTKVLVVNSNPKPTDLSFSLRLADHYLQELQSQSNVEVERIDLYSEEVPLIDGTVLDAWGKAAQGQELSAEQGRILGRMNEILEQFLAADVVVFVTPMWNIGFPPMVRAYIDNITIAGRTFKYTAEGPQGLAGDKKVVHIEARGGVYGEGSTPQPFQFTGGYLQAILGFIGITNFESVIVEGMAAMPDQAEQLLAAAKERATESARNLLK
ncbi:NAD(P)H-dependent oxidoreductase [Paenibacillus sp. 481]|uniref:NAD(P)H-dependent oxidoreductase n=1 Tax=Paenibacillus sp. 481 TaxID=2835869 RepID=UPI001E2FE22E|nr:NAD(P)H-dependent oxidoreductase [Paenibacillus sp. 481]UHA72375.1 NAD(P)H-dependent oxidoreductase [Paenibacillus sp. 481]